VQTFFEDDAAAAAAGRARRRAVRLHHQLRRHHRHAVLEPGGVETVPTQIFAMLRNSISPEINALGTVMIVLTVGLPLLGAAIARQLAQKRRITAPGKAEHEGDHDGQHKRYERLLERYGNGDLDRRKFLGLIGAAGLPMACRRRLPAQALAATEQVRFDGWGGVVSEAFRKYAFDPYTEKTRKVVDGTFGGGDEYLSRVKASQPGEYNIAHLSGVFDYARYANLGLPPTLNEANIPNLEYVIPKLVDVFRGVTDGKPPACPMTTAPRGSPITASTSPTRR
jgi:hypothetical protein